jgi:hypothetical protein
VPKKPSAPESSTISDVLAAISTRIGGPEGIANQFRAVFDKAPEGSYIRARLLQSFMGLMMAEAQLKGRVNENLDDLTDDELTDFLTSLRQESTQATPNDIAAPNSGLGSHDRKETDVSPVTDGDTGRLSPLDPIPEHEPRA